MNLKRLSAGRSRNIRTIYQRKTQRIQPTFWSPIVLCTFVPYISYVVYLSSTYVRKLYDDINVRQLSFRTLSLARDDHFVFLLLFFSFFFNRHCRRSSNHSSFFSLFFLSFFLDSRLCVKMISIITVLIKTENSTMTW